MMHLCITQCTYWTPLYLLKVTAFGSCDTLYYPLSWRNTLKRFTSSQLEIREKKVRISRNIHQTNCNRNHRLIGDTNPSDGIDRAYPCLIGLCRINRPHKIPKSHKSH